MIKSTDVRTTKVDGETYANVEDLIRKINEHGLTVGTAFTVPEFKNVYSMAYCHIEELLELIKEH